MQIEIKRIKSVSEKLKLKESEKAALIKLVTDLRTSWLEAKFKLFGSKVTGTTDEESDLDILILLPCDVTEKIRKQIIHKVFDINLIYETNISPLVMAEKEWERGLVPLLPIHAFIEEEGVLL